MSDSVILEYSKVNTSELSQFEEIVESSCPKSSIFTFIGLGLLEVMVRGKACQEYSGEVLKSFIETLTDSKQYFISEADSNNFEAVEALINIITEKENDRIQVDEWLHEHYMKKRFEDAPDRLTNVFRCMVSTQISSNVMKSEINGNNLKQNSIISILNVISKHFKVCLYVYRSIKPEIYTSSTKDPQPIIYLLEKTQQEFCLLRHKQHLDFDKRDEINFNLVVIPFVHLIIPENESQVSYYLPRPLDKNPGELKEPAKIGQEESKLKQENYDPSANKNLGNFFRGSVSYEAREKIQGPFPSPGGLTGPIIIKNQIENNGLNKSNPPISGNLMMPINKNPSSNEPATRKLEPNNPGPMALPINQNNIGQPDMRAQTSPIINFGTNLNNPSNIGLNPPPSQYDPAKANLNKPNQPILPRNNEVLPNSMGPILPISKNQSSNESGAGKIKLNLPGSGILPSTQNNLGQPDINGQNNPKSNIGMNMNKSSINSRPQIFTQNIPGQSNLNSQFQPIIPKNNESPSKINFDKPSLPVIKMPSENGPIKITAPLENIFSKSSEKTSNSPENPMPKVEITPKIVNGPHSQVNFGNSGSQINPFDNKNLIKKDTAPPEVQIPKTEKLNSNINSEVNAPINYPSLTNKTPQIIGNSNKGPALTNQNLNGPFVIPVHPNTNSGPQNLVMPNNKPAFLGNITNPSPQQGPHLPFSQMKEPPLSNQNKNEVFINSDSGPQLPFTQKKEPPLLDQFRNEVFVNPNSGSQLPFTQNKEPPLLDQFKSEVFVNPNSGSQLPFTQNKEPPLLDQFKNGLSVNPDMGPQLPFTQNKEPQLPFTQNKEPQLPFTQNKEPPLSDMGPQLPFTQKKEPPLLDQFNNEGLKNPDSGPQIPAIPNNQSPFLSKFTNPSPHSGPQLLFMPKNEPPLLDHLKKDGLANPNSGPQLPLTQKKEPPLLDQFKSDSSVPQSPVITEPTNLNQPLKINMPFTPNIVNPGMKNFMPPQPPFPNSQLRGGPILPNQGPDSSINQMPFPNFNQKKSDQPNFTNLDAKKPSKTSSEQEKKVIISAQPIDVNIRPNTGFSDPNAGQFIQNKKPEGENNPEAPPQVIFEPNQTNILKTPPEIKMAPNEPASNFGFQNRNSIPNLNKNSFQPQFYNPNQPDNPQMNPNLINQNPPELKYPSVNPPLMNNQGGYPIINPPKITIPPHPNFIKPSDPTETHLKQQIPSANPGNVIPNNPMPFVKQNPPPNSTSKLSQISGSERHYYEEAIQLLSDTIVSQNACTPQLKQNLNTLSQKFPYFQSFKPFLNLVSPKIQASGKTCSICKQAKDKEEFEIITCGDTNKCTVCSRCRTIKRIEDGCPQCQRFYSGYEIEMLEVAKDSIAN